MAGAYSNPPFSTQPSTTARPPILISKKPLLLACSLITPRPRKLTHRKNYLRQKILKTLTKPCPNPITEPIITPLETPFQHTNTLPSDQVDNELKFPENQELRLPEVSNPAGVVDVSELTFSETALQRTGISSSEMTTWENQEIQLREPAVVLNADAGYSGNSLLKFGLWVVGAFLFQTICAVGAFYSADGSGESGSLNQDGYKNEVLELDLKAKDKFRMSTLGNDNGKQSIGNEGTVFLNEAEMEKKIEEIRHMAREAREKERLESKGGDVDEEREDDIEDDDIETGIKKEVDERLVKLRKRLEKVSNKLPTKSVTYPRVDVERNDRDGGGKSEEKEVNAALTFKRKHKFKDFASKPHNKPKGFMSLGHQTVGTNGEKTLKGKAEVLKNKNGEGGVDGLGNHEADSLNLDSRRGASLNFRENLETKENTEEVESKTPASLKKSSKSMASGKNGRKVKKVEGEKVDGVKAVKKSSLQKIGRKKKRIASDLEENKPEICSSVDRNNGSSLFETVDSMESSFRETATISNSGNTLVEVVDSKDSRGMKNTATMNKSKVSNINGISRMNEEHKEVKPHGGTKSGNNIDFWWLSLPYVLVIRMRRGHDDEEPEGLYSLKDSSQVDGGSSHTVAFQDRGDATNFCYLLQFYFEDLGDFSAEIAPLPVKELSEAIRSRIMKVVVVPKGKLKLYAGQPLADAEMALRSLVEQQ